MALPTAPLGQLGNMSMPYSIPTYDRGPNIWEKALASFLVNAAGGVATQGTQNLMSRDYAPEFGKEKAGLWSRIVSGPTVGRDDARNLRQQAFLTGENEAARQGALDEQLLRDKNAALRIDQQGQLNQDELLLRDMNALVRGDRDIAVQTARDTSQREFEGTQRGLDRSSRMDLQQKEWEARRSMPDQQLNQTIVDRMRGTGLVSGTTGGNAQAGVNPNIAKFAQGGGAPAASPSAQGFDFPAAPEYVANEEDVIRMLVSGKSVDEINAIIARQKAITAAAQGLPSGPRTASNSILPELFRELGVFNSRPEPMPNRGAGY